MIAQQHGLATVAAEIYTATNSNSNTATSNNAAGV
jgi:hypothetical protein